MQEYILDYIITPDLNKKTAQGITAKIGEQISAQGKIIKSSPLKKTKLAYSIQDKTDGFLGRIEFLCNSGDVGKITQQLKQEPKVLRHILAKKPKEKKQKARKPSSAFKTKPGQEKESEPEKQGKKVDLDKIGEELDKLMQ